MSQLSFKPDLLARVRRIVVKVGSAVLSDADGLNSAVIDRLCADLDAIARSGRELIVVSSGAVAAGRARLGALRAGSVAVRQAAAAVGQIELMRQWAQAFSKRGREVAQILLTHQDLAERRHRLNASHTFRTLLSAGVLPIVNENDSVGLEELRLGDNDILSSLVATLVRAELLIILSDVPGVLTGDPRKGRDVKLVPVLADPKAVTKGLVADSAGPLGSGGMGNKLKAAQQAARAGVAVLIASGREPDILNKALDPQAQVGTLIVPGTARLKSRKHWIAFALRPAGSVAVDKGAAEALRLRGRSLLPSGIREVRGDFAGGDCVRLLDPDGVEFGRGVVNYPAADVLRVKGHRSHEIERLLGYKVADEIIHRDNFVLLEEPE